MLENGPLWVGLIVTLVSAIIGWVVCVNIRLTKVAPGFPTAAVETVRRRVQRDIDAVQIAAGSIAFYVATITDNRHASKLNGSVAFALGAGVPVVATLLLLTVVKIDKYDKYSWGIFTPFTDAMVAVYSGALVAAYLT